MKSVWKDESCVVLDACALIAFLNNEPGADVITSIFEDVASVEISIINVLEIAYDAMRRSGDPQSIRNVLDTCGQLPLKIHWQISDGVFQQAARFKADYKISLADAIALATAGTLGASLATSDHHEFDPLEEKAAARFIWIR
jgi:predicted nucleic acid-binding protein